MFANLEHCKNIEEALSHFDIFVKIFSLENGCQNFETVQKEVKVLKVDPINDDTKNVAKGIDFGDSKEDIKKRRDLPYFEIFKDRANLVMKNAEVTGEVNPFYANLLMNYAINYFLPYFPLWNASIISEFGLLRYSNAAAENFFKLLKHSLYQNQPR